MHGRAAALHHVLECFHQGHSANVQPLTPSPDHPLFFSLLFCRVDKSHYSMKYDIKEFMEAEFARRNLFKKIDKEKGK